MKQLLFLLGCAALLSAPARAQDLAAADRKKGVQYLESTRDGVLAATKGLSDAQWNFKPAPDRWSIATIAY